MTEPLITVPDFEEFRDGDPTRLIAAATQQVRSYCGWHIAPVVTSTVVVEGSGVALLLPTLRLTGITSIARDGAEIPVADVKWKPNGIVTGRHFCGDYEVTFTHGHEQTPEDIAQLIAATVADGTEGLRRLSSLSRGPFSESYFDSTDSDRATLDFYRLGPRP